MSALVLEGVELRTDGGELAPIGWMSDWGAPYTRGWLERGLVATTPHNSGGLGGADYHLTVAGVGAAQPVQTTT